MRLNALTSGHVICDKLNVCYTQAKKRHTVNARRILSVLSCEQHIVLLLQATAPSEV